MHEMGIASSILDGVAAEVGRRPGARPLKVGIRVGELAGLDPDALRFAFDALTIDTPLAGLQLDIDYRPSRSCCRDCGHEFEVHNSDLLCPACGGLSATVISGDELEFSYLEIEDPDLEAADCEPVNRNADSLKRFSGGART
jgi:hydrogenase nickel incorporation protein HypA/HybF